MPERKRSNSLAKLVEDFGLSDLFGDNDFGEDNSDEEN